ncbi:hypothetical protein BVRB_8g186510 isoform A [Beta vulgaris subsp. vulgaris]|uniref:Uncharacterized protein n=1 Tax=Beta vulgaris subsp. vulgaris TaxID=3555 RepID=A0A0J8BVQ0_BETVV|nr:hypothetical protein BVRB_8g186510 isoform A [Beta vulgaris subsp. vulgaris]
MSLFLNDDEFERIKLSGDAFAVAEKADSYIRDLNLVVFICEVVKRLPQISIVVTPELSLSSENIHSSGGPTNVGDPSCFASIYSASRSFFTALNYHLDSPDNNPFAMLVDALYWLSLT